MSILKTVVLESAIDDMKKKLNITKTEKNCIGFSDKDQSWYGWSHRACVGFTIGDKIFEEDFGTDSTPYTKHGSVTIKTLDQAKQSAKNFAKYIS